MGSGLVLALVVGLGFLRARTLLERELEAKAVETAQAAACRMAVVTEALERTAETAADIVGDHRSFSPDELVDLLRRTVDRNAELFGSALVLEERAPERGPFAPYVFRDRDGLTVTSLATESYHFETWDWYLLPKHSGRPQWSEPYHDEGGGEALMATYSVPLRDGRGTFLGVMTADLSLPWLTERMDSLSRPESEAFSFLLSAQGTIIAHPRRDWIMNESLFSLAEAWGDDDLARLGRRMIAGEGGFAPVTFDGNPGWLAFSTVGDTGWSLAVFFPRAELLRDVATLSRAQATAALAGLTLLLAFVWALARSITGPLRTLDAAVQAMGSGDATAPLPPPSGDDEVSRLTASFSAMREEIAGYMAELARTAAARERIESELRIGRAIQMSLVPKTFPPFPDRNEFCLHALLEPAKEVGGDFYDFFMTDEDHLCLVVGDVSGKGVPAALFMAVTRTFIKALSREESSPSRLMARLNDELAEGNDASMFVTLFFSVVDIRTGLLRYALGGHPPPLLIGTEGRARPLPSLKGPLVGAMEGMAFSEGEVVLRRGDLLLAFTDGVTEAMNPAEELFGDDRTAETLADLNRASCREIVGGFRRRLEAFADGAEQSDDITLLAFQFRGGEGP